MALRYLIMIASIVCIDFLFLYLNKNAFLYIMTAVFLVMVFITIGIAWAMKYDVLKVSLRALVALTVVIVAIYLVYGRSTTLARVEFDGAQFGLEYIPDPTLEGYKRTDHIFFVAEGEKKRSYIFKPHYGFAFSSFPADVNILADKKYEIIDTVTRDIERYPPTVAFSTLYIDPKFISEKSWNTFLKFARTEYKKPDEDNLLLVWINSHNGKPASKNLHASTIYSIVYAGLDDLETKYTSPDGTKSLKVSVDRSVKFNDTQLENPQWGYVGRLDGDVFFYQQSENPKDYDQYTSSNGKKFNSLYSELKPEF
jgi:hypothetical protein